MRTQYMHAMVLKFQLRKGVSVEAIGYVFSWEPELEPKQHNLSSCSDLKTLAEAYMHISTSKLTSSKVVLVDHTKGRKVEAMVAQLTQTEGDANAF